MVRLFASDLDGTLLNLSHDVDGPILSAVRAATDAGRHFAVATGRCMRSNASYGFAGVPIDIICANGALIYDAGGRLAHYELLDKGFLAELLEAFPDLPFDFIATDHTYVRTSEEAFYAVRRPRNPFMAIAMKGMIRAGGTEGDGEHVFDATPDLIMDQQVCKANVRVHDEGERHRLEAFLDEHADVVVNAPFRPTMFEITSRGVDKGSGVAWLAGSLGIPDDEVAVYGDGGNDVAMLERFSRSYVTSCAVPAAREAASAVIGSNVWHAVPRHVRRTLRRDADEGVPTV